MTPYELKIYTSAYAENKKMDSEEKLRLAYITSLWTSRWVWQKKVPGLDKILNKDKVNKKMAPDEILEEVKKLNASLGGTTY
jgi:hypothetical protein